MIEHQHQQKITRQAEAERKSQLATQRVQYIDNDNGTVTDTSTKLIWQQRDDGVQRNWQDAINYCNRLNLGGSNNWRLPTIAELKTLIDESRRPTIDAVFVDNNATYYWSRYWSADSSARYPDSAWFVDFYVGHFSDFSSKGYNLYVRCVKATRSDGLTDHLRQQQTSQIEVDRQQQTDQNESYIDNGNGTVTDSSTKLIWQQRDDGKERIWENAMSYCDSLALGGNSNWRLPTIDELKSLINQSIRPTIDLAFDNSKSDPYWSATPSQRHSKLRWGVNFYYGHLNDFNETDIAYVRCVR